MTKRVEIFAIGDELLHGEVEDKNSPWLCRQVTRLGAKTCRVAQLPDEKEAIIAELRRFLASGSDILFTTGGLGLSDDEKTPSYVAAALERPFEVHDEALRMVQRRYEELADENKVASTRLNEIRKKMSYLPRGASPLENTSGVAPGMILKAKEGAIVCLSGEPEEMKTMFEGALREHLSELFPNAHFHQEILQTRVPDETDLIPAMRHARARHEVSLKTRTTRDEDGLLFWIMISASGADRDEVMERVLTAKRQLKDELSSTSEVEEMNSKVCAETSGPVVLNEEEEGDIPVVATPELALDAQAVAGRDEEE
jgi:molybdenum cofactor synthesis domain-containing protein